MVFSLYLSMEIGKERQSLTWRLCSNLQEVLIKLAFSMRFMLLDWPVTTSKSSSYAGNRGGESSIPPAFMLRMSNSSELDSLSIRLSSHGAGFRILSESAEDSRLGLTKGRGHLELLC